MFANTLGYGVCAGCTMTEKTPRCIKPTHLLHKIGKNLIVLPVCEEYYFQQQKLAIVTVATADIPGLIRRCCLFAIFEEIFHQANLGACSPS